MMPMRQSSKDGKYVFGETYMDADGKKVVIFNYFVG